QLGGGLDVAVHQRIPVLDQAAELLEQLHHALFVGGVAGDDELVALSADPDAEEGFDVLEVGVARSVERLDAGLRQDDSLHACVTRCAEANAVPEAAAASRRTARSSSYPRRWPFWGRRSLRE